MNSDFSTDQSSYVFEVDPSNVHSRRRLDIKQMLRLRAPLIIIVFITLSIPAVLGAWISTPLEYEVTAELRFLASTPRVLNDSSATSIAIPYEKFINTQITLITGPAILARVAAEPDVRNIPEVAQQPDALEFLQQKVQARIRRNSELVTISCKLRDKEGARLLLDRIVNTYLDYALGEEANIGGERLRILMKERDARQIELDHLNRQVSNLHKKLGIPVASLSEVGPSEVEVYRISLARAEEDLSFTASRIEDTTHKLEQTAALRDSYNASPSKKIFALGIEDVVSSDPRVAGLRQHFLQSESGLAVLEERFREGSPRLSVEQENHRTLRGELDTLEQKVRDDALKSLQATLEQELLSLQRSNENAQERQEKFQGFLDEHTSRAMQASATMAELEELKMKSEETRSTLRNLRQTISAISLESNAPARVQLVSQPIVPTRPDYGKRLQFMVLGLLGSFSLAMAAALARELTDEKTRSPRDISTITPAPVLASIPYIKPDHAPGVMDTSMFTADYPESPMADEYRRILARIIYPPDDTIEVNSCLVVSPTRGDGKTSLACNLAISLAQANRRVLLVDVCPKDPSVELCFGMEPGEGLGEIVREAVSYHTAIQESYLPNLSVLGPGQNAEDLAGKIASREMIAFLEWAEKEFDHVIIDTPPALIMSDAKLLAPVVDGVVVVVGTETSTLGMVRRCLRELEQVNANLLGLVLNGIRPTRGGYLRQNMDIYNRYGDRREREPKNGDIPEMKVSGAKQSDETGPPVMLLTETDGSSADKPLP